MKNYNSEDVYKILADAQIEIEKLRRNGSKHKAYNSALFDSITAIEDCRKKYFFELRDKTSKDINQIIRELWK